MKFRSILFWAHLCCGVAAGLVILMLSVTGVLLTYERQVVSWADRQSLAAVTPVGERAALADIIAAAQAYAPGVQPSAVTVWPDATAAVAVTLGRGHTVFVDPFAARVLGEGATGVRQFFSWVTHMHRWFAVSDEHRATARAITGAANLLFLFIVLSGMYLWLPRVWRGTQFRMRLWFTRKPKSGKARDFNWHHVFGIWMCVPLVLIIASATVFSYDWANSLVYRVFGEPVPQRGGPPGRGPGPGPAHQATPGSADLDALLAAASRDAGQWNTMVLSLPVTKEARVIFDRGTGGQPQRQSVLVLNAESGRYLHTESFADQSPGRQARIILRRLHTGEVLGIGGQTLAGIASLAAVMLVWTGLALAWRRLVAPLSARRRSFREA